MSGSGIYSCTNRWQMNHPLDNRIWRRRVFKSKNRTNWGRGRGTGVLDGWCHYLGLAIINPCLVVVYSCTNRWQMNHPLDNRIWRRRVFTSKNQTNWDGKGYRSLYAPYANIYLYFECFSWWFHGKYGL